MRIFLAALPALRGVWDGMQGPPQLLVTLNTLSLRPICLDDLRRGWCDFRHSFLFFLEGACMRVLEMCGVVLLILREAQSNKYRGGQRLWQKNW